MLKKLLLAIALSGIGILPAKAATLSFDVEIDSISGEGQAENVGFFQSGRVGDAGIGSGRFDETQSDLTRVLLNSFFGIQVAGGTGGTRFDTVFDHDVAAGTYTLSGIMGGLTGNFPGLLSVPGAFEFVFTNTAASGTPVTSGMELLDFMSGATMSGFISGAFVSVDDEDVGYRQTVTFSGDISTVPLPAGLVLLLTGVGAISIARRKNV